jgi:hypothetical protein
MDIFLLEKYVHSKSLKLSYAFQTVQGIATEAGQALCNDHINLGIPAIQHQPLECIPLLNTGTGDALICIDA